MGSGCIQCSPTALTVMCYSGLQLCHLVQSLGWLAASVDNSNVQYRLRL